MSAALRTLTTGDLTGHGTVASTAHRPRLLFVSAEFLRPHRFQPAPLTGS